MKTLRIAPIVMLLTMAACVHAQRSGLGGTGGAGGVSGVQLNAQPLQITTSSLPNGTNGTAYSQTLTATGGTAPYSWSIIFGALPTGLSLNSSTGAITGTPSASGTVSFSVVATDSTSPTHLTATATLSISVDCPILQITSSSPIPPGTAGVAYSFQVQSSGGLAPLTFSATGVPTGLSLSSAGALTGTPSGAGQSIISVTLADSCTPSAQSVTSDLSLTVNNPVVIQTTSPLPNGTAGIAYSTQLAAAGGTSPYTWSVISGALPTGLSMASTGIISGTPTTSGVYTFTAQVVDSAAHTTNGIFVITIGCPALSITSSAALPAATQNLPYSFQFLSAGGLAPVSWLLESGSSAPSGLSLSSGGLLSGTPTTATAGAFTVTVNDSCSQTATQDETLTVNSALQITTSATLPAGTVAQPYNLQVQATGGTPPYSWSVPAGTIPNGAEDILDYAAMPVATRYTSHLSATGLYKAYRLDAGLLWWIKNSQGYPWDGEAYDGSYVKQWFTEMDSSQNAACVAAGWPSCFADPKAYKKYRTPVNLWARYHVPGADDVVYTAGPNVYDLTVNCGLDNQTGIDNLGIRGELTGPFTNVTWQTTYGGSIPDGTPYLLAQKWTKCSANDITTCQNEEDYWLVKGYGQVRWCPKTWNGSTYVTGTCTTQTQVSAGAPTPNFACTVPATNATNGLPPGVPLASSPSLELKDSTGVISGTPSQAGTYTPQVQVEDSLGLIAQSSMSMSVTCPAFSITSTSPLPNGTQGIAYSTQLQFSGGIAPVIWTESGTLPTGMTLSSSGLLSGTPTNFGSFLMTVVATDSCAGQGPNSRLATFSFTIAQNTGPVTITTTSPLPPAKQGTAYSTQLAVTGGTGPYTWSITAGHLPPGLNLAASTGIISGTPAAVETDSPTFKVVDSLTANTTKALTLAVTCPTLSLVSTSPLPNGTQNQPYAFQFQASGGITPYTWAKTGGTFPGGLTLVLSGALTGTPTANGAFSPTVQVSDGCSPTPQTAATTYSLTIAAAIPPLAITTTSPLPAATVGKAYSASLSATGGVTPYTWALTAGSLPAGLILNSSTGVISGTPTTAQVTTPTFRVTDSAATTASQAFSITVTCTPLAITSISPLPNGTQSSPYSFQFTSSGGQGTVNWTGSAVPTGLSLSLPGALSGTPSGSGTATLSITATDSCSTPQVANGSFALTVSAAPVPLSITTPSPLPNGTQNQAYSVQMAATGGTPPYGTWTVTSGALPTGLSLNSSTGVISGTPTVLQTTTPTIRVADNVAATASKAFSIAILGASGADNRNCNSNNVWQGTPTDGPATLPTQCMNTAIVNTPSTGTVRTVTTAATFNTAYAASACGDVIQITAGSVITGPLTMTAKNCNAGHWITIQSSGVSNALFPKEGTRLTPCAAGISSMPTRPGYPCPTPTNLMASIVAQNATNSALLNGADHIRWIGVKFTRVPTKVVIFNLVDLGSQWKGTPTNNIIFDRVWFAGIQGVFPQNSTNDTSTTRGVFLAQSNRVAVIDSYMSDFYTNSVTSANGSTDSQCIGGGSGGIQNSGWGVYKFVNNHCEASGEGILLGGSGAPQLSPAGCTVMVNCNLDVPTDIEVRRNYFLKPLVWYCGLVGGCGAGYPITKNGFEMKIGARALFEANVVENVWYGAQVGWCWTLAPKNQSSGGTPNVGAAPTALTNDFTYRYNYCYNAANGPGYYATMDAGCATCQSQGMNRVSDHDNLMDDALITFSCCRGDEWVMTSVPDATGRGLNKLQNVSIRHDTFVRGVRYSLGIGAGGANLIFSLTWQDNIIANALGVGSNPSVSGCSTTNSFVQILSSCVTGSTVNHNGVFNVASLPTWPGGNTALATSAAVGFVNYNAGDSLFNPANYALTLASPLHNAASDGKDVGADISQIMLMISGVRQ